MPATGAMSCAATWLTTADARPAPIAAVLSGTRAEGGAVRAM